MKEYILRFIKLVIGLFGYALGIYFCLQANIGLAPWDAFHAGLARVTGGSIGNMVMYSGLVIIILDFILGEKIGIGSVGNAILIGQFLNVIMYFDPLPLFDNFLLGVVILCIGLVIVSISTYLYAGTALGCGPRDALMVALMKRMPKVPVGLMRAIIEGCALIVGFLCGAKVGVGTIIAVVAVGFIMQFTFKILKFNVKGIKHEDFADTFRNFKKIKS